MSQCKDKVAGAYGCKALRQHDGADILSGALAVPVRRGTRPQHVELARICGATGFLQQWFQCYVLTAVLDPLCQMMDLQDRKLRRWEMGAGCLRQAGCSAGKKVMQAVTRTAPEVQYDRTGQPRWPIWEHSALCAPVGSRRCWPSSARTQGGWEATGGRHWRCCVTSRPARGCAPTRHVCEPRVREAEDRAGAQAGPFGWTGMRGGPGCCRRLSGERRLNAGNQLRGKRNCGRGPPPSLPAIQLALCGIQFTSGWR